MTTASVQRNPYTTAGNFAPVAQEMTATELTVVGEIPEELSGRFVRNGPNPADRIDSMGHHWFSGAGMVHGVRVDAGRAIWYRNRWVRGSAADASRSEGALAEGSRRAALSPNTNVGGFAGTTWALVEGGTPPVELSYELDSVGRNSFFGTLPHGFTAHPKRDIDSGELHALCYSWAQLTDHIEYIVVGTDGRVRSTLDIPLPGRSMIHDMSLTENYVVIYDLPVLLHPDAEKSGDFTFTFRWNDEYGARVGLLPREGPADQIVLCDVEPCYVVHPLNAYEDGDGRVVVDLCRYERLFDHDVLGPAGDSLPTLDRWTVNPRTRIVNEERIDDRFHEFPVVRGDLTGRAHRFGYTVGVGDHFVTGSVYKHDVVTGVTTEHDFGPGRGSSEASFVPRANGESEDDGWLLSYAYDAASNSSELAILDARDLARPAVARILLPQRVPYGFHGNWIPDTTVAPA
jgi:carotenoid cleavage dioxygenase